jgi:hypothetical protein
MILGEVIALTQEGVSLYLKTPNALEPWGELLKVVVDGKGSVHLFADDEMKEKHGFVFHANDWFRDLTED